MSKKKSKGPPREKKMHRLTVELPEDVIRSLKARAASQGKAPRDLVVEWVRSWPIQLHAPLYATIMQIEREEQRKRRKRNRSGGRSKR